MLINPAGLVFVGERHGPVLHAWQMPQGGVDPDEEPSAAAMRELREEVGTDRAALLRESRFWYAYDLAPDLIPIHWNGRYRGQSQKWFAFRFIGTDEDVDITGHEPEFVRWRWAPPGEVLSLVVDFKRPVYQAVFDEFGDLLAA